jgi:hypothetical protein
MPLPPLKEISASIILTKFDYQQWQKLCVFHSVQIGSIAHQVSCAVGTPEIILRDLKRQGRDADHSAQSSEEVKNAWLSTSTPY